MKLLRKLIDGVTHENVYKRIGWLYVTFFGILFPVTIATYYLLPESILRGKHPIASRIELSSDLLISTLQIFGYNLLPMVLIAAANLIATRSRISRERFVPAGYQAFWALTALVGVYLGTWSFEVVTAAPPLHVRLLRTFDVVHHSGLLEFSAYLLAAATSYALTLWFRERRKAVRTRRWKDIKLTRSEKVLMVLAPVLLLCAALIEAYRIIQVEK